MRGKLQNDMQSTFDTKANQMRSIQMVDVHNDPHFGQEIPNPLRLCFTLVKPFDIHNLSVW
jgi:hypothetical protein